MFASTKQMGTCTGGPDVCKTPMPPPVGQAPIPYPNMANCPMAMDPSTKVFISGSNALIQNQISPPATAMKPAPSEAWSRARIWEKWNTCSAVWW
jgi:hypothetical protein